MRRPILERAARRHAQHRGVALLAAVAGVALLGTLAVGVGHWALAGTRLATSTADALQAEASLRSGLAIAAVLLEERRAAGVPDTLADVLDGAPIARTLGGGRLEIRIEDAARRLDLSAPELSPALARLLSAQALDPALADTLADWIDADDVPRTRGAERAWYLARRPPVLPANSPLGATGHLAFVRGWSSEAIERVRPFVATAGERGVNPNTASPEVLAAWLGDAGAARAMLERRARAPLPCSGMPACVTRSAFYLVDVEARVHGAVRAAQATLWVPPRGPAEIRAVGPSAPKKRGRPERVA